MCGIVGYVGREAAAPILLAGLERLEYRGYDSAGIAVIHDGSINTEKAKGRLSILSEKVGGGSLVSGSTGIGHTRWATHGKPSDENSHPHSSSSGKYSIVHNGIIENYVSIREELIGEGYRFQSETDTEVIAHLLEKLDDGNFLSTVQHVMHKLEGSFACAILNSQCPGEIIAIRRSSPLVIGLAEGSNYIASDIPAILAYTRNIMRLEDDEIAWLTAEGVSFFDDGLHPIEKEPEQITWDVSAAEKGGYEHFMLKEIMEQAQAVHDTISPRIGDNGEIVLDGVTLTRQQLRKVDRIYIVACGSAYHVGMVGKMVIEQLTRIPVDVDLASEFRYRNPIVDKNTLAIIISQSGETADTIAALRELKARGARVLSVVNVVGSTIANESDDVLYTWAGPEIAVATTKAYSTQLIIMYIIGLYISTVLKKTDPEELRRILSNMLELPDIIEGMFQQADYIKELAKEFKDLEHAYFLGRNLDYALALEASLKLKEISYIHSEAYAAGELKHGTISLIEPGTLVVALACNKRIISKTLSNIQEVKARGARVLILTTVGSAEVEAEGDYVIRIPESHELLMPSIEVVPMQMLGYYIALWRGCDIDKPRNLAKSVTVE